MKVTIELSAKDIQKVLADKIRQEASKHSHPDNMDIRIVVFDSKGRRASLEALDMEIHADLEEKPEKS